MPGRTRAEPARAPDRTGAGGLEIDGLTVDTGAARPILADVSLRVAPGEVVGLVGESGSGKSTTARAVLRLLPPGARVTGSVRVAGSDVLALDGPGLRRHRASRVAMIYQDSRAALHPMRRVGDQVAERIVTAAEGRPARAEIRERVVELFTAVGLPDPGRRVRQYPHELSGGMLQRVMIAAALATGADLLLADEATSALDVTTQAATLKVLRERRAERGAGMLFITHDLPLAAAYCDRVYVMYAGRIVEERTAADLFTDPRHPYTAGLLACAPDLTDPRPVVPIPGRPPSLDDRFGGCPFAPRCPNADDACTTWHPEPRDVDGAPVACLHPVEGRR